MEARLRKITRCLRGAVEKLEQASASDKASKEVNYTEQTVSVLVVVIWVVDEQAIMPCFARCTMRYCIACHLEGSFLSLNEVCVYLCMTRAVPFLPSYTLTTAKAR